VVVDNNPEPENATILLLPMEVVNVVEFHPKARTAILNLV